MTLASRVSTIGSAAAARPASRGASIEATCTAPFGLVVATDEAVAAGEWIGLLAAHEDLRFRSARALSA